MTPSTIARRAVLTGIPVTSLLVVVATSLALSGDLPAEIPSNWRGNTATATMGLVPYTALIGLVVVGLGLLMDTLRRRVGEPVSQRVLGGVGAGVPAALAAMHVGILLSVRAQEPPYEPPVAALAVAGLVLVAVGALGAAVVQPEWRRADTIRPDEVEIAPGEAIVWTGASSAPTWAWGIVVVVLGVAAVLVVAELAWIAVLVALGALAISTLLTVAVTVGPGGITARMGPLRVVRFHVPLGEVTGVHAELVDPLAYGGWGLRWLPGVRGVILRTGPGLRIEQADGPDLVVTVEGAAEAAGVLLAHLEAHRIDAAGTA